MIFRVDAESVLDLGQGALFVDRLATAPWNRDALVTTPMFRGAGSGLLTYAIAMSYNLGLSGRVTLFPIANHSFYENRGFIPVETKPDGETLYELPTVAARAILIERGLIDG